MSNDLISRSALLEDFKNTITERSDTFDWLNIISRQPAAYDVDKVVGQLERDKFIEQEIILSDVHQGYNAGLAKAVEIVKAGGVNEQSITNIIQYRDGSGDTGRKKDGYKESG